MRSAAVVSCRKLTRAPHETSPAVVATGEHHGRVLLHGEVVRAVYALPDAHPEHLRVKAMDDSLKRFDNEEAGFSIHDVDLSPACPHALLTFLDVISDQDAKEHECEGSAFEDTTYKGRDTCFTNV